MIVSPGSIRPASFITVPSVASPDGTMTHAARGLVSFLTKSSIESAPAAPSFARPFTLSGLRSNTTHSWPARIKRRTMFPPIRPRPIIPSCIVSLFLSGERLRESFLDRRGERRQTLADIVQVDSQRPAVSLGEHFEISARLRRLHHAERELLPRYRKVGRIVTGNLQKYPCVRSAFVCLSRRVQEARSESQTCRHALFVAYGFADCLQRPIMHLVHLDVSEQRKIIASLDPPEVRAQITGQRFVVSGGRRKRARILRIRKEIDAGLRMNRRFSR